MGDINSKLVQNIQSLAQTVGTDIKNIKTRVDTLSNSSSSVRGVPTLDFSVESNGDVYVDITYPEVTPVAPTSASSKEYDVIWGSAQPGAPGTGRGYLEYSPLTGFGKLHLDMKIPSATGSGNGGALCTLPANSPVPSKLLEVSVNANNNSVYIEPNSRVIKGWAVPGSGKRYILDIVGFWKETK